MHPNASGEGKAVILIKWNKTHNMFELNEQAVEVNLNENREGGKIRISSFTSFRYSQLTKTGRNQRCHSFQLWEIK